METHPKMTDTDLIACLYPVDGRGGRRARKVIDAKSNRSRYVEPQLSQPFPELSEDEYNRYERQPTEPLEEHQELPSYLYEPCLQFRFSRGPQTPHGFVFGWDPNSDVVLPSDLPGISFHHFALTFDDCNRPSMKDLASFNGTEVTYDTEGGGKRTDFIWIVGGHAIPNRKKMIVINVSEDLKFQIVISHHVITSQLYIDNVNRFRQETSNTNNLLGRLNLRSRPQTERASGAHTPGTGAIVLTKRLGEGAFGVVSHMWNVSTGNEYAVKEPSLKAIRENKLDIDAWRNEARIIGQVSHDHIVGFLGATFTPVPKLYFEYVPGGALEDHENISTAEGIQILQQCLSALKELHRRRPPIVHRDIKPGNILVKHRYPGSIYVKFGDFGLSRGSPDPTTICGSPQYLAPEIYNEQHRRSAHREKRSYTPAVDIWSLGVAVFDCTYDLPSSHARGVFWCEEIVKKLKRDLERIPDDLKQFLWDNMVILQPELRRSAHYCHGQSMLLSDPGEDCCQTPNPTSVSHAYQQPARQYYAADVYGEDQQTILAAETHAAAAIWPSPSRDKVSIDSAELHDRASDSAISAFTGKMAKQSLPSGRGPTKRLESISSQQLESEVRSFPGLWDPLHPLGGGSSLAAFMGQETSDLNGYTTRTSTSRSVQEPVREGPDPQALEDHSIGVVLDPHPCLAGGDGLAYVGKGEFAEQIVGDALTDGEQELATELLVEISNGRYQ